MWLYIVRFKEIKQNLKKTFFEWRHLSSAETFSSLHVQKFIDFKINKIQDRIVENDEGKKSDKSWKEFLLVNSWIIDSFSFVPMIMNNIKFETLSFFKSKFSIQFKRKYHNGRIAKIGMKFFNQNWHSVQRLKSFSTQKWHQIKRKEKENEYLIWKPLNRYDTILLLSVLPLQNGINSMQ